MIEARKSFCRNKLWTAIAQEMKLDKRHMELLTAHPEEDDT